MKKMRKIFALLLSFVMIMGMAVTANAATTQTTTEDTDVFKLEATVSGATVSYQAITVEGGGKYEDSTVYNYYISLPSGSSASSVAVKATFPAEDTLYIGGTAQTATDGVYTGTVDLSSTKTFTLKKGDSEVRSFQVAAGVTGEVVPTVYVRVDVVNAISWLEDNDKEATEAAVNALIEAVTANGYTVTDDGQMTTFVPVSGLTAGSTAMDALKAACNTLGLTTAGSNYYVSGIGVSGSMLSERATTAYSGWLYLDKPVSSQTFKMANYGASSYSLNGGEQFVWCFANGWDSSQYSYLND